MMRPMSKCDITSREIEMLMLDELANRFSPPIDYNRRTGMCAANGQAAAAVDRQHRQRWHTVVFQETGK
jgi:hypothetical protein